jgi:TonB family protein
VAPEVLTVSAGGAAGESVHPRAREWVRQASTQQAGWESRSRKQSTVRNPSFSQEARKAKAQGVVVLVLVVGKDGHPYHIRLGQSLGMGLDEKAIEAVSRWRFRPATLDGQPVSMQIAVQADFHLY